MSRNEDINIFYKIILDAEHKIGGKKYLSDCNGRMQWVKDIKQGVYFFFEDGEFRDSNKEICITRVGTHAVSKNSKSSLWERLRTHKGRNNLKGNHRTSVFRQLVGDSIDNKCNLNISSWNLSDVTNEEKIKEIELEKKVSEYICKMPFVYIKAEDEAGPNSIRSIIEKKSIALLSNYYREPIDNKSTEWLGKSSFSNYVKESGLWNQKYVDINYNCNFLERLNILVSAM